MIFILSDNSDYSTNQVIDWVHFHKKEFIRVNFEDNIITLSISLGDSESIELGFDNGVKVNFSKIESYWYRRGNFVLKMSHNKSIFLNNDLTKHLNDEWETIFSFLHKKLQTPHSLGTFGKESINKLEALSIANLLDIDIPKTKILTKEFDLHEFIISTKENCITKSISEQFVSYDKEQNIFNYSPIIKLKKEDLNINNNTFPTLIQERINRQFDLRIFYLDKKCFSMAIFNTSNDDTIDIRDNLDLEKCRTVPYKIPIWLSKKINLLMERLSLNTGSLDFVVTQENHFVFLEVNPIGQYSFLSEDCNYYIDEKIAKYLINN